MNGLAGNAPSRRLSRETRHLLIAVFVALAVLWILARIRFPERTPTTSPIPPLLTQLSSRPGFAELEAELTRVQARLQSSLTRLSLSGAAGNDVSVRPALRISDDTAVAVLEPSLSATVETVARDEATGLSVLRVPSVPRSFAPVPWSAEQVSTPQFLLAAVATSDAIWLQPLVVGGMTRQSLPGWYDRVWRLAATADVPAGALLFTHEGELVGATVRDGDTVLVVPGDLLLGEAQRLVARGPHPSVELGIDVQELSPVLAQATGAAHGVVVSWVRSPDVTAAGLMIGDAIEAVDGVAIHSVREWQVRVARMQESQMTTLDVMRSGARRSFVVTATRPADAEARPAPPLGMTLRQAGALGSEVLRVDPGSAAERAGVMAGDLVVMVEGARAPSPSDIREAFAAAQRPVVLGVSRGRAHHVLALVK
jgi:hypothetical protein